MCNEVWIIRSYCFSYVDSWVYIVDGLSFFVLVCRVIVPEICILNEARYLNIKLDCKVYLVNCYRSTYFHTYKNICLSINLSVSTFDSHMEF